MYECSKFGTSEESEVDFCGCSVEFSSILRSSTNIMGLAGGGSPNGCRGLLDWYLGLVGRLKVLVSFISDLFTGLPVSLKSKVKSLGNCWRSIGPLKINKDHLMCGYAWN